MRIALDARTLTAPKTGDRTVTLGLVRGLSALAEAEDLQLTCLSRTEIPPGLLPDNARVRSLQLPFPGGYLWMPLAFPRGLRQARADVALLHYMGPFSAPCPFVTIIHDTVWRTMPQTFPTRDRLILDLFIPGTIRRAAAVVTVSEFSKSEILRHFPGASGKVHVVPNAVEARFRPVGDGHLLDEVRQRYGLPARYVLSVGVLQPRKNLSGLILAHRRLPGALRSEYPLVIAGKRGWQEADTLRLASEDPAIVLPGYVADDHLPALYTMASCLVYPSLYEGFGLPPVEAMACGTPVITSNVASLPEVTAGAAVLVDPTDVEAISAAMERVLGEEAVRRELIAKGFARAGELSWEASARTLLEVLAEVVTRR